VRDGLFSGIPAQQRYAIDRIDAWRCRAPRSLPVSIISTVDLLRLAVLDGVVNLEQSSDEVDDTHLRLAYSMTLVRFVNLSTGECPHGVTKPLPQDVLPEKETSSYEHRCV